jgi:hypothetical protein
MMQLVINNTDIKSQKRHLHAHIGGGQEWWKAIIKIDRAFWSKGKSDGWLGNSYSEWEKISIAREPAKERRGNLEGRDGQCDW